MYQHLDIFKKVRRRLKPNRIEGISNLKPDSSSSRQQDNSIFWGRDKISFQIDILCFRLCCVVFPEQVKGECIILGVVTLCQLSQQLEAMKYQTTLTGTADTLIIGLVVIMQNNDPLRMLSHGVECTDCSQTSCSYLRHSECREEGVWPVQRTNEGSRVARGGRGCSCNVSQVWQCVCSHPGTDQ